MCKGACKEYRMSARVSVMGVQGVQVECAEVRAMGVQRGMWRMSVQGSVQWVCKEGMVNVQRGVQWLCKGCSMRVHRGVPWVCKGVCKERRMCVQR